MRPLVAAIVLLASLPCGQAFAAENDAPTSGKPATRPLGPTLLRVGPTAQRASPVIAPVGPTVQLVGPTTAPSGRATLPGGPTTRPSGSTTQPTAATGVAAPLPAAKPGGRSQAAVQPRPKARPPTTEELEIVRNLRLLKDLEVLRHLHFVQQLKHLKLDAIP